MSTVLTIAGSDSSGGAGIQADLKTISANGGYGLCVLTAVTAQNTKTVTAAFALPVDVIEAQFAALFDDFEIHAAKSGMLADHERVAVVAACMRRYRPPHYVLDPVMISTSGFPLLVADAVSAMREELLPLAALVTPNVHEAQMFAGMDIRTVADAVEAGRRILDLGPQAVLVKGGHLEEQPGTDVLVSHDGAEVIEGEYLDSRNTHGTGCTLSAAIATHLADGVDLSTAVHRAKQYLTEAIRYGPVLGQGVRPTDHFFMLRHTTVHSDTPRPRDARGGGTMSTSQHAIPRLQVITDEQIQSRYSHIEIMEMALRGGADAVQFREKRAWATRALIDVVTTMLPIARQYGGMLIVDDRPDVALSAGATAVHLGRNDLDVATARRILGQDALIGGTANSFEEAARAWETDIDYLGVGPIYGTHTKANPAPDMGLATLARICSACPIPVIAIGSITAERIADVIQAGAYGVAIVSAVVASEDVEAATRMCRERLDAALLKSQATPP